MLEFNLLKLWKDWGQNQHCKLILWPLHACCGKSAPSQTKQTRKTRIHLTLLQLPTYGLTSEKKLGFEHLIYLFCCCCFLLFKHEHVCEYMCEQHVEAWSWLWLSSSVTPHFMYWERVSQLNLECTSPTSLRWPACPSDPLRLPGIGITDNCLIFTCMVVLHWAISSAWRLFYFYLRQDLLSTRLALNLISSLRWPWTPISMSQSWNYRWAPLWYLWSVLGQNLYSVYMRQVL